jgi:hypothetical protein
MLKYLTSAQYRFFYRKLYSVQASIWEAEFKITKSRQVREGVRQDRDRTVEIANNLANAVKTEKDEAKKDELEANALKAKDDIKRYEAQMKMVDDQINGSNGDESHEPVIGLVEQIKSLVELKAMYKDYMNRI